MAAAAAAAAASVAWDVEEVAFLPPLSLPREWETVHALRRARALVTDSMAAGRATLDASIDRYRVLEEDAVRQRAIGSGHAHGSSRSWDGTLFAHVLVQSTANKCLMRAVLLALAISAGGARLRRSLVVQITQPRRAALVRAVFKVGYQCSLCCVLAHLPLVTPCPPSARYALPPICPSPEFLPSRCLSIRPVRFEGVQRGRLVASGRS